MLVMKMRSSSPVNRLVGLYRGFMCMYKKNKKTKTKQQKQQKKKVASYNWLSPATGTVSSNWRKPAVNGYRPKKKKKERKKKKKKEVVLIGYFAYYIPLWDQCIK